MSKSSHVCSPFRIHSPLFPFLAHCALPKVGEVLFSCWKMLADALTEYVPKCELFIRLLLHRLSLAWGCDERKNVVSGTNYGVGNLGEYGGVQAWPVFSHVEPGTLNCKMRGLDNMILETGTQ